MALKMDVVFLVVVLLITLAQGMRVPKEDQSPADFKADLLVEEGRGRRRQEKYLLPLLFAALLVKAIIFPLAFKAMAVMTSVAVFISGLSLILSSIVGYKKMAATTHESDLKRVFKLQGLDRISKQGLTGYPVLNKKTNVRDFSLPF